MKKSKWRIRQVADEARGSVVHEYDLTVYLPDGTPHRERRNVPEFDDEGRRVVTKAERERYVARRFAFLHEHGKEDPEAIKKRVEAKRATVGAFLESWLARREAEALASVREERGRLRYHVIPRIGEVPLVDLRPHHARDLLRELRQAPSRKGGKLAPRTIRHVYFLLRQAMHDAVVDELIPANPIQVSAAEVPEKRDKDLTWRSGAVFRHEEIEALISDPRIPEDRRVAYAIEALTGARTGEASALCWRHYDPTTGPLGRITIEVAYNSPLHRVKATKTERPRLIPVHSTLAAVLAGWKLGGWQRLHGRAPKADDLIVPARGGGHRNVSYALDLFHEDLKALGLRERRHYDLRRSFISLGVGDGASKDLLRWVTHTPGDVFDGYTTPPWPALCEAVGKLRVRLLSGGGAEVIPLGATGAKLGASVEERAEG